LEHGHRRLHGRARAHRLACDQAHGDAVVGQHGQLVGAVVGEGRVALLVAARQRHPGLDAGEELRRLARFGGRALGVGDAAAGGHQVQRAGADGQLRAEAVAVHDLAVEQVGRGGEADVRVRADVDALADDELRRAHLVPEDEGADHLPPRRGKGAADLEAAEVAGAGDDDGLDGVAGALVAGRGVVGGLPAHGCVLLAGRRASSSTRARSKVGPQRPAGKARADGGVAESERMCGLLEPSADLGRVLRVLAVEGAPLQDALDGLGHVQPAAAERGGRAA
jgi:hypothetical protein